MRGVHYQRFDFTAIAYDKKSKFSGDIVMASQYYLSRQYICLVKGKLSRVRH